jgi:ribosomal protein S18 acetylase RimI-like enzyme
MDVVVPGADVRSRTGWGDPSPIDAGAPSPAVSVRPADDDDRPFLFAVFASARREVLAPLGWDERAKQSFLRTQFEAEERDWRRYRGVQDLVVLRGDQPVGRIALAEDDHEMRILDLTLLPAHRGQGIGSRLLAALLDQARRSHRTVRMHVERSNRALELCRRMGFLHAATRGGTWLMEWTAEAAG